MAATPELDLCPFTIPVAFDNDGMAIDAGNAAITNAHPAGFFESSARCTTATAIAVTVVVVTIIVKTVTVVVSVTATIEITTVVTAYMAPMAMPAREVEPGAANREIDMKFCGICCV